MKARPSRSLTLTLMLIAAFVLLGIARETSAQASPYEPAPIAGWVITPALGFGGTWDDNVLMAHPGDNPPRDYASPISPSIDLLYTGRRTRFNTAYDGSWVLYRSLTEMNSFDQTLRASLDHRVTRRLTLVASESYTQSATTDALMLAGVPFYRIGSTTNAGGGGVDFALAKHTSMRAGYTHRIVRFDVDDRIGGELRGGHAHEFVAAFERALTARLKLLADYGLIRATVGDHVVATDPADSFSIHTGRGVILYQLSPVLSVSAGVGASRLDAGLTHEARTAPAWQAGLTYQQRYATWSASYQRSLVPSYGFGGTFQNEELVGTVRVPFARNRAYADGAVSWYDADAIQSSEPSLRSVWFAGKLGYFATRWLQIEGFYNRAQQDTQRAGGQLARNHFGVRVITSRPLRIR